MAGDYSLEWRTRLVQKFRARGSDLKTAEPAAEEALAKLPADFPRALVALLRVADGIEEHAGLNEFGEPIEHRLIKPARAIADEVAFIDAEHRLIKDLLVIGSRGGLGHSVHFVMERASTAEHVGIYWGDYDEIDWRCASLADFLDSVASGTVASEAELSTIDPADPRANAARCRINVSMERGAARRKRNLPSPERPHDWRAHILRAYPSDNPPTLAPPISCPRSILLRVCEAPPLVLVDLLSATDGVFNQRACYKEFLGCEEVVQRTQDARESSEVLDQCLVIGAAGVDGILFVMEDGAESNRVGVYNPLDDEVQWEAEMLSDFINRWAEGSLLV